MARVWTDGAEHGTNRFWSATTGTVTASTTQKYSGSYSYNLAANSTATKNTTALTSFYLRFRWRSGASSNNEIFRIAESDGSVMAELEYLPTTDAFRAVRGTGTELQTTAGVLAANTWGLQ